MNVVPAQIAGVEGIAVASPPQKETGRPDARVLAACALLGVDEVYAVGGAQAIAMFAYGAGICEPVDVVTGPGNIYVTAAKRLLRGLVGIDAEAGPTEIAILADDTRRPGARRGRPDQPGRARPVGGERAGHRLGRAGRRGRRRAGPPGRRRPSTPDRIAAALTGPQSGIVLVDDLDAGLRGRRRVRGRAPGDPDPRRAGCAARVRNAGAIFVGAYSPVSLGDYCAGSNHVLPTGGCARHSGGLSVQTFLRGIHVIDYDEPALRDVAAARGRRWPTRRTCPRTAQAITARFRT